MDDVPVHRFKSVEEAEEFGIDAEHVAIHMMETVLCVYNGDPAGLDLGFYYSFRDTAHRTWTLSVIPEDGGVIADALLHEATQEDS